ncbi:MAG: hypothetical protein RBR86_06230 [Pseudobdellovibrionaceae bacterium]|jgi:hypothetical protein|nr:hypothetical protein [Pseudobdellovibrionaceae bacterium]
MMDFDAAAESNDPFNDNPMGDETVPLQAYGPVYGSDRGFSSRSTLGRASASVFAGAPVGNMKDVYSRHILDCGHISLPDEHQGGTIRSQDIPLPPEFDPYVHCVPAPKKR